MNSRSILLVLFVASLLVLAGCTSKSGKENLTKENNGETSSDGQFSACPVNFGEQNVSLFLSLTEQVLGIYPDNTTQEFFDLASHIGAEPRVFFVVNTEKELENDFYYEGGFKKKGFGSCEKGRKQGENINYLYCKNFAIFKDQISDSGEIGKKIRMSVTPVFDIKNLAFEEIQETSHPQINKPSGGKLYKVNGAEEKFDCEDLPW